LELARRNVPYHKYGGLRFLEFAHVKDVISILRVLENPRDDMAWFRVLQLLPGIGPGIASRAVSHMAGRGRDPASLSDFPAPPSARPGIAALVRLIGDLGPGRQAPPAAQVERIRVFYAPLLRELYENPAPRERDLDTIEQLAAAYRSRRSFITDLQLDPPTSTSDLAGPPSRDEDWLVLSTIHSAKGCEWDVVHLIHASDGCLPSDMATGTPEEIEEELRLAYVAMTRARNFLYVEWPVRYYHSWHRHTDRHTYAQMSRFLSPAVTATMEAVQEGAPEPGADAPPEARAGTSIAGRLRSKWD